MDSISGRQQRKKTTDIDSLRDQVKSIQQVSFFHSYLSFLYTYRYVRHDGLKI